jgi:hypothetical protein
LVKGAWKNQVLDNPLVTVKKLSIFGISPQDSHFHAWRKAEPVLNRRRFGHMLMSSVIVNGRMCGYEGELRGVEGQAKGLKMGQLILSLGPAQRH